MKPPPLTPGAIVVPPLKKWRYDKAIYKSPEWRRATREVRMRDKWRCKQCGSIDGTLAVHHIKPLLKGGAPFALDNLELLCKRCHNNKHPKRQPKWMEGEWGNFTKELLR